ncbi:MAG: hypothetical protein QXK89_00515 [Candidatus Bathyarchaeia archaeon]
MRRSISEIIRYGEDVGTLLRIETGIGSAETLRNFFEDISSPALKINYDPANIFHFGLGKVIRGVRILWN